MSVRFLDRLHTSDLVAQLRDSERVAVDTEFHAEGRWRPKLYLLQIMSPTATPGSWIRSWAA